ncbi:MAG: tRNA uridine-5-carboxymethylaminomethyl(34) synthesis GTPase MnmE [Bacillota bacterium]|nr:tRNA uridine-5-carboxymethylaminomethyl(34) synthesis GTPase MnmE [Bacillota bacterium]
MSEAVTVAAISTALVNAAIGVVRLTGTDAIKIAGKAFHPKSGKLLTEYAANSAVFGSVTDKSGERIDDAVCSIFREPYSYTGENVAEISCHGNVLLLTRVLNRLIECGAYPAERGEFTKRAFLNGKMDLSQSEAVIDIIGAKSSLGAKEAFSQASGSLRRRITKLRGQLADIDASIMAFVDFSSEGIEEPDVLSTANDLNKIIADIDELIESYNTGRIIKDGIPTAICGRPNVGKSSLLNMLSGTEKSIVTEIAGTTRDIISESVEVGGILFNISDTAGIRESNETVEKIGVERAKNAILNSELVICVFDRTAPLTDEDFDIIKLTADKKCIAVINKSDLPDALDREIIHKHFNNVIEISAKTGEGADKLSKKLVKTAVGEISFDYSEPHLTNIRHKNAVLKAREAVLRAKDALLSGIPAEIAELDVRDALSSLGLITGDTVTDDIIDRIFENFCVGK